MRVLAMAGLAFGSLLHSAAATMQLPVMGYGLRYEYGIFKQSIQNGWQKEMPDNWLRFPDPWEVARPNEKVEINLGCSFELSAGSLRPVPGRPSTLFGIPFDRPVVGYGGSTINTLRLGQRLPQTTSTLNSSLKVILWRPSLRTSWLKR